MAPPRTIREDLAGTVTVHISGVATNLHPGDRVPNGVEIDEALLASYDGDSDAPSPAPDPLSEPERARALDLGIGEDELASLPAEWVRGFVEGYDAGSTAASAAALAAAATGPDDSDGDAGVTVHGQAGNEASVEVDYDPGAEGQDVAAVLAELEKRPEAEQLAILRKEAEGKGRVGVLQSKYADELTAAGKSWA